MRRLVGGFLVVVAMLLVPQVAYAHDVLRTTDPADGATVDTVPEQIVLTFDQPAISQGSAVVVRAEDGRDVAVGAPVLVDTTVRQLVGGALPAGRYTVLWRVTSADGHPVDGTFTFTARTARTATVTASPTPEAPPGQGSFPVVWLVVGIGALVLLAYAATRLRRNHP